MLVFWDEIPTWQGSVRHGFRPLMGVPELNRCAPWRVEGYLVQMARTIFRGSSRMQALISRHPSSREMVREPSIPFILKSLALLLISELGLGSDCRGFGTTSLKPGRHESQDEGTSGTSRGPVGPKGTLMIWMVNPCKSSHAQSGL